MSEPDLTCVDCGVTVSDKKSSGWIGTPRCHTGRVEDFDDILWRCPDCYEKQTAQLWSESLG